MVRLIDFVQRNATFYLILAAVVVINLLVFLGGAYREVRLFRDSETVLQETRNQLRNVKREQEHISEVAGNVNAVRKRIQHFFEDELQPGGDALPELTRRLYDILNSNRMDFQHVTYTRKAELKGRLSRVVIHVPVKASYDDLQKLLTDLEGLPFPTMVDRVSVSSTMGREVNATIDIVSYFREP